MTISNNKTSANSRTVAEMVPSLADRLKSFHLVEQPVSMFGGKNQTSLRIELLSQNIRYLRIRNPSSGHINLSSIKIFGSSGSPIAPDSVVMQISSLHNCANENIVGYENMTSKIKLSLLDSSVKSVNFRTGKEKDPWIILDLGTSQCLSGIELSTRKNHLAKRDWMLELETSKDMENWQIVHSQVNSLTQRTEQELLTAKADLTDIEYKIYSNSIKISNMYIRQGKLSKRNITDELEVHGLSMDEQAGVKYCVNRVLKPYQAEIAAHGVTRSYRFWSENEKREELEHANEVIKVLESLVGEACLGFGSCLGAVREGDFIPHDDDIDIIVFHQSSNEKEFEPATADLLNLLVENGVNATEATPYHVRVSMSPGKKVDVFCGLKRKEKLDWHPGKKSLHTYDDIFPAVTIPFLGTQSLVPKNVVLYLERVYGQSWRIPMPFFAHRSDRSSSFTPTKKVA